MNASQLQDVLLYFLLRLFFALLQYFYEYLSHSRQYCDLAYLIYHCTEDVRFLEVKYFFGIDLACFLFAWILEPTNRAIQKISIVKQLFSN